MSRIRARLVSSVLVSLLSVAVFGVVLNVPAVRAGGTIYIRADGSVDPPTAPIQRDGNMYTFTGNVSDSIVVEKDSIVVDGAGYTIQGTGAFDSRGINLLGRSSVTIKNAEILGFDYGITLSESSGNYIFGNNMIENGVSLSNSSNNNVYLNNIVSGGVSMVSSSNSNIVSGNNINGVYTGVCIADSSYNVVCGNNITNYSYWAVDLGGSYNTISGNNITNNFAGIGLEHLSNSNIISANNITNNDWGIGGGSGLGVYSYNNTFSRNTIANNRNDGINLYHAENTIVRGNTIANNGRYGVDLVGMGQASNNIFYHNNLINNTKHVDTWERAIWDNGYPSGGNYWSNYTGVDANNDGIGDTPHDISAWGYNNVDRYPLMNPWTPPEHELVASIEAPTSLWLGSSTSLKATVTNQGLGNESNVELMLLINGTTVDSTTIPLLQADESYTRSYLWTPTAEGTYNVTAYAHPVLGEKSTENNQKTKFVTVSTLPTPSEVQVGVRAGDWIKCTYAISGWPAGTPYPEWLKVEFTSIEGTMASVRVTMHMSNGTELSENVPVDVMAGGQAFGLSGFVIPANSKVGDSINFGGFGITSTATIEGETTRTYAGASRTVVYASFSQLGSQLTYYWDKQTGVMVEASTTSGSITATGKATETNMWQAQSSGLPFDQIYLYVLVAVIVAIAVGAIAFAMHRKKKPPEAVAPTASTLQTTHSMRKIDARSTVRPRVCTGLCVEPTHHKGT